MDETRDACARRLLCATMLSAVLVWWCIEVLKGTQRAGAGLIVSEPVRVRCDVEFTVSEALLS